MSIDKNVYEKVLKTLENMRMEAAYEQNIRLLKAYEQNPEIEDIDRRMTNSGAEAMMRIISDPNSGENEAANMVSVMANLESERKKALLKVGLSEDYTDIRYSCSICSDTGFKDGKMCECFKRLAAVEAKKSSDIGLVMESQKFDSFDLSVFSKEKNKDGISVYDTMQDNFNLAKKYVADFGENSKNLLLYGDVGTGKTFLSCCIANALIDAGFNVIYRNAGMLFADYIAVTFNRGNVDAAASRIKSAEQSEFLIIDDLGTEAVTTHTASYLFTLLNSRIISNKKTLISTNLTFSEMGSLYSKRVVSRFFESYMLINCPGEDLRFKKLKA